MIVWANNLQSSEKTEKAIRRIKRRVQYGRFLRQIYCITIPQNTQNVMDIVVAKDLKQRPYCDMTIKIIGVARGEGAAKELVRRMVEEMYLKTGGFDAEQYYA